MPSAPKAHAPAEMRAWALWVGSRLASLGRRVAILEKNAPNGEQQLAGSIKAISKQVLALPVTTSVQADNSGFGLASGWNTVASLSIPVPSGKTRANIQVMGGAAAMDMTSGGVTSLNSRIVLDGDASATFPSSKDAGASRVNNIVAPSMSRSLDGVSGSIGISLQMSPLNPTAFTAQGTNFASLSAIAVFTN